MQKYKESSSENILESLLRIVTLKCWLSILKYYSLHIGKIAEFPRILAISVRPRQTNAPVWNQTRTGGQVHWLHLFGPMMGALDLTLECNGIKF